jgi:ribosomal protein S18 acetylase RimI-like enzyme
VAPNVDFARPSDADHEAIVRRIDDWAGGRRARQLVPRLWFRHFTGTSWVARLDSGRIAGVAIGFVSPDDPSTAVLHLVAVDPAHRRNGIGRELIDRFLADLRSEGVQTVATTAWPDDRPTIHFLEAIGFALVAPEGRPRLYGMPAIADYDEPGDDRAELELRIAPD